MQVSLIGYHGTVSNMSDSKEKNEIMNQLSSGMDFLALCDKYFGSISDLINKEVEQKAFRGKNHKKSGRFIWGQIESGTYGHGSTLTNVTTKATSYERATDDAELLPFFYLLYVPTGYRQAILILQKNGNLGIKSVLSDSLIKRFNSENEDYGLKLQFKPYLDPQALYDYLTRGEFKKIRFISHSLPRDLADKVKQPDGKMSKGEAELVLRKLSESAIKKIFGDTMFGDLKAGRATRGAILPDINFDYDQIKIELSRTSATGPRPKVIDLLGQYGIIQSREIDLHSAGVILEKGLPDYKSIHSKALDYLEDLCHNLNIAKPNPRPVF